MVTTTKRLAWMTRCKCEIGAYPVPRYDARGNYICFCCNYCWADKVDQLRQAERQERGLDEC